MDIDDVSGEIVDAAVKLHMRFGPGLMESVYEVLLANELVRRGLAVERQLCVPLELDHVRFNKALRIDLLVEGSVVVEVKAVDQVAPAHRKQVLTYLRLMDLRVGLLINFNEATLKDGLHRLVNRYVPSASPRLRANQDVSQTNGPEETRRLRANQDVRRAGESEEAPVQPPGSSSRMT